MADVPSRSGQEISVRDVFFLLEALWYDEKLTEIADAITSNLARRFPDLDIEDLKSYFKKAIQDYISLQHKDKPLSSEQELTQVLQALRDASEDLQLQLLQSALRFAQEHIDTVRALADPTSKTREDISKTYEGSEF